MKIVLIAALALSTAAPVAALPTSADAQVLAGRSAARASARHSRPALSAREEDRLYAALDQVTALEQQIEALETEGATAGGLTPEQAAQVASHRSQLAEAQTIIDRLEAKRARHEGN